MNPPRMNPKDLPTDRLATADRLGNRVYLYPTEVRGFFRSLRSQLGFFLILLFLGLPWLRIGGHQAVLFDIPQRRFAILGLTFWAHDAPLLIFVFGGAVILLGFVTAVWGRVWCGWACPQTVFVDRVFRKIEGWIEGDSVRRKKLDQSPLSVEKMLRKTAKWLAFTICALIISHSFLAYFIGTEALAAMARSTPSENPGSFLLMAGVTAGILFDFGWFREQFCTLLCPYGRFQSVLMDEDSQVVAYDLKRGEPRRGMHQTAGDCINCYRCVQVCPTGIDIRRGVQLECIACTACMDACDDVMGRIGLPLGLIRYGNQAMAEGKAATGNEAQKSSWYTRPRPLAYLGLLLSCIAGLTVTVLSRTPIKMTLIRAVDSPYQEVAGPGGEPEVINHFKLDLRNQTFDPQTLSYTLIKGLTEKKIRLILSPQKEVLGAGESERADLFVRFPKSLLTSGRALISIDVHAQSAKALEQAKRESTLHQEVSLVGPFH